MVSSVQRSVRLSSSEGDDDIAPFPARKHSVEERVSRDDIHTSSPGITSDLPLADLTDGSEASSSS
jgi:hypothetical protein